MKGRGRRSQIALGGERFWDRFAAAEDRALREQVKAFLASAVSPVSFKTWVQDLGGQAPRPLARRDTRAGPASNRRAVPKVSRC